MKTPAYRYRARFVRVIDGDTYELGIDLGFKAMLVVTVRLRGVDTPEMDTKAGKAAKAYVQRLAEQPGEWPLIVETFKDRSGEGVQTFARWVADVWLPDGERLAHVLVEVGHGKVDIR